MLKQQGISVVAKINAMLAEADDRLSAFDRETLTQLANDPDIEKVWGKITKACTANFLIVRIVISEIVGARRRAAAADGLPDLPRPCRNGRNSYQILKRIGWGACAVPNDRQRDVCVV